MLVLTLAGLVGFVALVLVAGALATLVISSVIEARYPPAGRFVEVEGGRLMVVEAGPKEPGPGRGTVLLVHGASGNAEDPMRALGRRLAGEAFRVVAFDRPGLGWSDRVGGAEAASPAVQGRMIREGLGRLGIAHAIVVGHSLAGAVATSMALESPDLVSGLVLLSPVTHPWPNGTISDVYRASTARFLGGVFAHTLVAPAGMVSMRSMVAAVFAPQPAPDDFVDGASLPLILRPSTFLANAEDVAGLHDFVRGQSGRYGAIRVPTTIVAGDADRIVSTDIHARRIATEIEGARLLVLPGIGHMPHYAATDVVVDEIKAVAARIAPESNGAAIHPESR